MHVYIGSTMERFANQHESNPGLGKIILLVIGGVGTAVLIHYIYQLAKKEVKEVQRIDTEAARDVDSEPFVDHYDIDAV